MLSSPPPLDGNPKPGPPDEAVFAVEFAPNPKPAPEADELEPELPNEAAETAGFELAPKA